MGAIGVAISGAMMRSDHEANKDAEQHPTKKWYNHKPTRITKAIAALVVYGLFIFLDVHDIWPWSRGWAVFAGILATIALLYMEAFATEAISFLVFLICSVVAIFAGLVIYREAPPILAEETEFHGWLSPAAETTPPNPCDSAATSLSPPTITFIAGGNAFASNRSGPQGIMTIDGTPLIAVKLDGNKLLLAIDIYDDAANLAVRIRRDEIHMIPGEFSYRERSDDRSKLWIFDKKGGELLYLNYANPNTVIIRGNFISPKGTRVSIDRDSIRIGTRPPSSLNSNCSVNTNGFEVRDGKILF